jgi:hypothetical protein
LPMAAAQLPKFESLGTNQRRNVGPPINWIVSNWRLSRRNFRRPERLVFRMGAPEFVISLDCFVSHQNRGVR